MTLFEYHVYRARKRRRQEWAKLLAIVAAMASFAIVVSVAISTLLMRSGLL